MSQRNVKPIFEIEKLEGTRIVQTCQRVNGAFVYTDVEVPAGYMVYFPHGHSLRLDEAEMKRRGFFGRSGLVDMDSGELIEDHQPVSLKQHNAHMTKHVRTQSIPLEG